MLSFSTIACQVQEASRVWPTRLQLKVFGRRTHTSKISK